MYKINLIDERGSWGDAIQSNFRTIAGPYHQWEYVDLEAMRTGSKPCMILIEGFNGKVVALSLLIRKIPNCENLCDAISVYGYNGILGLDALTAEEQVKTVSIFKNTLSQMGCVSLYNRPYPSSQCVTPGAKYVGDVLAIDLAQTVATYEACLAKSYAYDIRKLKLAGVTVNIDSDYRYLEEFYSIYVQTMTDRNAAEMYFFSLDYFRSLLRAVSIKAELWLAMTEGKVAAGAIFLKSEKDIFYHFSASRYDLTKYSATKLLIDDAVRSAIQEGGRQFLHLGGGLGAQKDSLFDFKKRFGAKALPYSTDNWIIRPADYDALSLCIKSNTRPDFFPAYRA